MNERLDEAIHDALHLSDEDLLALLKYVEALIRRRQPGAMTDAVHPNPPMGARPPSGADIVLGVTTVEELMARSVEPPVGQGWQPIETANLHVVALAAAIEAEYVPPRLRWKIGVDTPNPGAMPITYVFFVGETEPKPRVTAYMPLPTPPQK